MNILIAQEIDWLKKVTFEPHYLAELFSLKGHQVFVMDVPEPDIKNLSKGFHTSLISNYHRVYDKASITIIRPPSILIKGLNRISYFITCKNVIKKTIIENEIDIIMTYNTITGGRQIMKVAAELNIPTICRQLDVAHGLIRERFLKSLAKKSEKFVLNKTTKILTTTHELGRYSEEMGAKKENVEYLPTGVNLEDFKPLKKDFQFAKGLGIDKEDKVIVFIGTIYDFAGLGEIVNKFQILKNRVKNIKLLVVGGGPYFEKLKSLVKEKKLESNVILVGFKPQKEIPRYISLADICINPFVIKDVTNRIVPVKIFEYLACGKPVISTPLKGTKELLPNEDFGVVYSTSEMFVESLANILTDETKLQKLSNNEYNYVKENHDWNVIADKLLKKFENLIEDNK